MAKLLAAFEASPSRKTAEAIYRHIAKHPMSACFVSSELAGRMARACLAER